MEFHPTSELHRDLAENIIDTQQIAGHTIEGGPLPAFLLTNWFEETPGTYDPYSYYDYSRRTLADNRADAPLWENETPRDTRKWSKMRMNVRTTGTRSGADPANHPEMFYGFLDEDNRTPGDDHFPAWKLAQQMAARAHYLKPSEPEDATHLGEGVPGDIEPENERYKKLNRARAIVRRNLKMFGRTIENDQARAGRDWQPLPCVGAAQRVEWHPEEEKYTRTAHIARRMKPDATLDVSRASQENGGGLEQMPELNTGDNDIRAIGAPNVDLRAAQERTGPDARKGEYVEAAALARGGPDLALALARQMRAQTDGIMLDAAQAETMPAAQPRRWHLDDGDQLALLHRATAHDAARGAEILHIAEAIARNGMVLPQSLPHLVVNGRRGPEAGLTSDMVPSYLMVDAVLMKRACQRPRELDLIRKHMITDAKAPISSELLHAARRTYNVARQARSSAVMASKTWRDIEMASDALELHNLAQARIGDSYASEARARMEMAEVPQLIVAPSLESCAKRSTPRESAVRSRGQRSAILASRGDAGDIDASLQHIPHCGRAVMRDSNFLAPMTERDIAPASARLSGSIMPARIKTFA